MTQHYPYVRPMAEAPESVARRRQERALDVLARQDTPGRWAVDAACGAEGVDETVRDVFTADRIVGSELRAAQSLCEVCPVFAECRAWAEGVRPVTGVWAGVMYRGYRSTLNGVADADELDRILARPGRSLAAGDGVEDVLGAPDAA